MDELDDSAFTDDEAADWVEDQLEPWPDIEEGFDAGEWNNMPGGPEEERARRTGAHVLQTARALGWQDDGEGALEFLLRRAREVAIEDCRELPADEP